MALVVKNPPANAGDTRDARDTLSIPGSGRSPGIGNGNPLQYSCLENPRDREAWRARVYRVSKSWIQLEQLSTHTYLLAVLGLSCSRWDLVPWLGIEPGLPALGVWGLNHWTTREVSTMLSFPSSSSNADSSGLGWGPGMSILNTPPPALHPEDSDSQGPEATPTSKTPMCWEEEPRKPAPSWQAGPSLVKSAQGTPSTVAGPQQVQSESVH